MLLLWVALFFREALCLLSPRQCSSFSNLVCETCTLSKLNRKLLRFSDTAVNFRLLSVMEIVAQEESRSCCASTANYACWSEAPFRLSTVV